MDRREFLSVSAASLAGFALFGIPDSAFAKTSSKNPRKYSVVILGDTHFDTEPASVYHSFYNEPVEWLNRVQRAEFARNGEMWRDRCPRLLKRCASLVDDNTIMAFQMGDLIQGDCGKGEVHQKMLNDVMDAFKKEFKGLPFVTVVGNHDIRGVDAEKVYHEYMPKRMSQELGKDIQKTTFYFTIGPDAFLVLDFNRPDSVWSNEGRGSYKIITDKTEDYGMMRMKMNMKTMPNGSPIEDESALFEEYRPGLTRYIHSNAAGSFKLNVGPRHITLDFYAGDSAVKPVLYPPIN